MSQNNSTTISVRYLAETQKATDATERLSKITSEAAKQEEILQKRLNGRAGAADAIGRAAGRQAGRALGGGRIGGLLGGALGSSFGGAAGALGTGAAIYGAAVVGIDKTSQVLNVANNSFLNAGQKADELARAFIPGAGAVAHLMDSLKGLDDAARRAGVTRAFNTLSIQSAAERGALADTLGAEKANAKIRAGALAGVKIKDTLSGIDQSTFAGSIAYGEAAARFPHQAAIARAGAESAAAAEAARQADERERIARGRQGRLRGEVQRRSAALEGAFKRGDQPGVNVAENNLRITKAAYRLQEASQKLAAGEARLQEEANRAREAGVTAAQKQFELSKARLAAEKEEANLLSQHIARKSSAATSLGGMNAAQRAMASQALRRIQGGANVSALPPSLVGLAEAVAPGFVGKAKERQGENTKEYQGLLAAGIIDTDKNTLAQNREALSKMQVATEVKISLDEAALADKIAAAVNRHFQNLLHDVSAKFEAKQANLLAGQHLRNATQ